MTVLNKLPAPLTMSERFRHRLASRIVRFEDWLHNKLCSIAWRISANLEQLAIWIRPPVPDCSDAWPLNQKAAGELANAKARLTDDDILLLQQRQNDGSPF